jgi:hypothetical protein
MSKPNPHAPYRNGFEAAVAQQVGPDFAYETVKLSYTLDYTYLPDFVDEEHKIIKEVKGLFDAADRRKILKVKETYPDWTIIMVFQKPDKKISKISKTSYGDWCDKHGIKWEQGPASIKAPRKPRINVPKVRVPTRPKTRSK